MGLLIITGKTVIYIDIHISIYMDFILIHKGLQIKNRETAKFKNRQKKLRHFTEDMQMANESLKNVL